MDFTQVPLLPLPLPGCVPLGRLGTLSVTLTEVLLQLLRLPGGQQTPTAPAPLALCSAGCLWLLPPWGALGLPQEGGLNGTMTAPWGSFPMAGLR